MATSEIGIKLGLSGASSVSSGLSQIVDKLGDMDMASLKVGDALKGLGLAAVRTTAPRRPAAPGHP